MTNSNYNRQHDKLKYDIDKIYIGQFSDLSKCKKHPSNFKTIWMHSLMNYNYRLLGIKMMEQEYKTILPCEPTFINPQRYSVDNWNEQAVCMECL